MYWHMEQVLRGDTNPWNPFHIFMNDNVNHPHTSTCYKSTCTRKLYHIALKMKALLKYN